MRPESPQEKPGPVLALRRRLGRVRRAFVWDTFDVFRRKVTDADRAFANNTEYQFSWGTPADVESCEESRTELDARERREGVARLSMGHSCVVAIVFTMWMNPRNINIPNHIKRRLQPHQSFIYKAFTCPEHRGRKLYELGMRFVLAELARQGKSELLGYAHVNKSVSRKGLAAVAFDTIGKFDKIGVAGFAKVFVSSQLASSLPEALPSSGLPADQLLTRCQEVRKPLE
jgi:hypothetical protein